MADSTVLVTGGAGFIGSHLCRRLLRDGFRVVALDNFHTGSMEKLADLADNPDFSVVRHDVIQPYDLEADAIVNLACPASPVHYQADPVRTLRTNVDGVYNALELAKKRGIPVLQASTSEVYGDPVEHPQTEHYRGNVDTLSIRACYDEGKRCGETLCADFRRQYGVSVGIVRIFNTYGPAMDAKDGRVVGNFILQALRGEPLTVFGDGSQTRSFCYISDLVDALMLLLRHPGGLPFGPVNLGNPGEFTVLELAQIVLKMTGSCSKIVYFPLPEADPRKRRPDISRAEGLLSWRPRIPLRSGLEKTIAYFKEILAHGYGGIHV